MIRVTEWRDKPDATPTVWHINALHVIRVAQADDNAQCGTYLVLSGGSHGWAVVVQESVEAIVEQVDTELARLMKPNLHLTAGAGGAGSPAAGGGDGGTGGALHVVLGGSTEV